MATRDTKIPGDIREDDYIKVEAFSDNHRVGKVKISGEDIW